MGRKGVSGKLRKGGYLVVSYGRKRTELMVCLREEEEIVGDRLRKAETVNMKMHIQCSRTRKNYYKITSKYSRIRRLCFRV